MKNGLIFENNKLSELLVSKFFLTSKIYISKSCCEKEDILSFCEKYEPAIILIEYDLYQQSIYDTISKIKSMLKNSKIIITTNNKNKRIMQSLIAQGADYVLIKPFTEVEIIKLLSEL